MEISNYFLSIVWFICVPLVAGFMWSNKNEVLSFRGILENWIMGTVALMGIAQILLVPMIARHIPFEIFVKGWIGCVGVICCISILKNKNKISKQILVKRYFGRWRQNIWLFCAVVIILVQCIIAAYLQHSDADDARFIAEAVIAVEQNRMYLDSPITGYEMGELIGEVRKDLTSPWTMYIALFSKLCNIAPAILAHRIMPFYFILLFYVTMSMTAAVLFDNNKEKIVWFILFLSIYNIFDYTSTHTISTVLLFRIWQGKAFVAAGIIPIFLYWFYRRQHEVGSAKTYWAIGLTTFAGALASGIGNILSPIMIIVYGLMEAIKARKLSSGIKVWILIFPNLMYLVCQYYYFEIFIEPWYKI